MVQLITDRGRKSRTGLGVVLQILQKGGWQVNLLAGKNGFLARLVVIELLGEDGKAALDGAVKEVRFGKAKRQNALAVADAGLDRQRLTQTEEIIGAVVDPDKGSSQPAH